MTIPEILFYLDDKGFGGKSNDTFNVRDYAKWWRSLTPVQKLDLARRGDI